MFNYNSDSFVGQVMMKCCEESVKEFTYDSS